MKTVNLTRVKYIGASRMKSLKDLGITTLEQLHAMPVEKLAEISTIGRHYAKLIKDEVGEYFRQKPEGTAQESVPCEEIKAEEFKDTLIKKIEVLKKRLIRMDKYFKPPVKKKILDSYNEFRKRAKTLMNRIDGLDQIYDGLSEKVSKNLIKRADSLNSEFKKAGKKINNRKIQKLSREVQLLSKKLKKIFSEW